jgi:hypothetical protein
MLNISPFGMHSGVDVVAYSLRWILTDSAGKRVLRDHFYHNLTTSPATMLIPSGGLGFVSPFFAIVGYKQGRALNSAELADLNRMSQQAAVTVCLDGVFFKDGKFVGPDETLWYENALALTRERDAAMKEVLSRQGAGQSDAAVFDWVESLAKGRVPTEREGLKSVEMWSQLSRRQAAAILLGLYQRLGAGVAFDFAGKEVARPVQGFVKVPYHEK